MPPTWQSVTATVRSGCAADGLDLVQPFAVGAYNQAVDEPYRLPDFGRPRALGLLIGNSRALWPRFIRALRAKPQRLDDPNPLDAYVCEQVQSVLESLGARWEARWAHEAPPRRVAMQRLAHLSGLAFLSPTHLCVHRVYGPWIALRAAVVIDVDGPPPAPEPDNPCSACEARCVPAFQRALASAGDGGATQLAIAGQWTPWVAVRDACSVGRDYRYSEEQIQYHYAKERAVLARLVQSGEGGNREDAEEAEKE